MIMAQQRKLMETRSWWNAADVITRGTFNTTLSTQDERVSCVQYTRYRRSIPLQSLNNKLTYNSPLFASVAPELLDPFFFGLAVVPP